jgi:hypothetical protein
MDRQTLLIFVLGICIANGLFSPYLNIAIPITAALMPELFPKDREWVLFFSSVFLSSATLLFSGVPAALYERLIDRNPESLVSMFIWLGAALVLSLPALETLSRL